MAHLFGFIVSDDDFVGTKKAAQQHPKYKKLNLNNAHYSLLRPTVKH